MDSKKEQVHKEVFFYGKKAYVTSAIIVRKKGLKPDVPDYSSEDIKENK